MTADDRPLTPFAHLPRPLCMVAEGVVAVLAAIAATLILLGIGSVNSAYVSIHDSTPIPGLASPRLLTMTLVTSESNPTATSPDPAHPDGTWVSHRMFEYEPLGLWISSARFVGPKAKYQHRGLIVPVWMLAAAGMIAGAGRAAWSVRRDVRRRASLPQTPPSPRWRALVGVGRVWFWSTAALGAALVAAAPGNGWPVELIVERGSPSRLWGNPWPQLVFDSPFSGQVVILWRFLLVGTLGGSVFVVARCFGSSPGDAWEQLGDAPDTGG